MWSVTNFNDEAVKEICGACGSPVAKRSYSYIRRMKYVAGSDYEKKVLCRVYYEDGVPIAFFFANRCKTHVRLIEIAVRNEYQGKGIGKKTLYCLLSLMREDNLFTLTLRTPIKESAPGFWLAMGAKIMDVKGEDYEMELKIS